MAWEDDVADFMSDVVQGTYGGSITAKGEISNVVHSGPLLAAAGAQITDQASALAVCNAVMAVTPFSNTGDTASVHLSGKIRELTQAFIDSEP